MDLTLASLDQAQVTQACGKNRGPCWVEKAGGAVLWGDAAYDRRSLGCPCAWAAPAIELAHGRPLGHTGPRRCAASGMEGVQGGGCGEVSSLWLLLSPLLPAGPSPLVASLLPCFILFRSLAYLCLLGRVGNFFF